LGVDAPGLCASFVVPVALLATFIYNGEIETMEPEIVLIRGVPGSGKTTMAKKMVGYMHFEADMYLEVSGKYVYDAAKVPKAHDWCVASARAALEQGKNVVVSNTFAKVWELKRYIDLGYPFRIIEATGSWPNVHGVPQDRVELMKARWEPLSRVLKPGFPAR